MGSHSHTEDTSGSHTEYNLARNDALEHARLDDQANAIKALMHGRIVHAPLSFAPGPKIASFAEDGSGRPTIIDVGCGTGAVTRDLAQQFPEAKVYGVDISAVPPYADDPANVEYVQGDIKELAGAAEADAKAHGENISSSSSDGSGAGDPFFTPGTVDYIYQRLLILGMTDWSGYVRQMARLLRPGGYIEVHDIALIYYMRSPSSSTCASSPQQPNSGSGGGDGGSEAGHTSPLPPPSDAIISDTWRWRAALGRGAAQLGLDLDVGLHLHQLLAQPAAGLTDVRVRRYDVPVGTWMADREHRPETALIGRLWAETVASLYVDHALAGITRGLEDLGGVEMATLKQECQRTLAVEEGKYCCFYVGWARKL